MHAPCQRAADRRSRDGAANAVCVSAADARGWQVRFWTKLRFPSFRHVETVVHCAHLLRRCAQTTTEAHDPPFLRCLQRRFLRCDAAARTRTPERTERL